MSFFRHSEIYRSDVFDWPGNGVAAAPGLIVCDEFPAGYSSADCSPAGSASASPTVDHLALKSSCRSIVFHRTVNSVLTVCLSSGGHPKPPIALPSRISVIDEYLLNEDGWPDYKRFSQKLREYRNRIVHDVAMGNIMVGKVHLVPRKECIQNYRSMQAVEAAARDVEHLKKDFVIREEQMSGDMQGLQRSLNLLWQKPLRDLSRLLYAERNPFLMAKYNLLLE